MAQQHEQVIADRWGKS